MRKIVVLIYIGLLLTISLQASKSKRTKEKTTYYKVKPGDSLSMVAKRFKTTMKRLKALNRLKSAKIRIGQRLIVPYQKPKKTLKKEKKKVVKKTKIKKKANKKIVKKEKKIKNKNKNKRVTQTINRRTTKKFIRYRVDKGDTISYIARRFHVTKKEIVVLNNLSIYKLPKAGKVLKIPNYKYWSSTRERLKDLDLKRVAKLQKTKSYRVGKGDTLFSIARKFKMPIDDLARINGIKSTEVLKAGQRLKIPAVNYSKLALNNKQNNTKTSSSSKKEESLKSKSKESKTDKKQDKDNKKELIAKSKKVDKKDDKKTQKSSDKKFYTVQSGDSIKSIAKKNGLSTKELMKLNKLTYKSRLKAGEKLIIAKNSSKDKKDSLNKSLKETSKNKTVTTASKGKDTKDKNKDDKKKPKNRIYTVRRGDTLWSIAKKHNLTIGELKSLNKLGRRDIILKGMKLVVVKSDSDEVKKRVEPKKQTKTTKIAQNDTKKRQERVKVAFLKKQRDDYLRKLKKVAPKGTKFTILDVQSSSSRSSNSKVIRTAKRFLGTRYVWGARGPRGFDCSGFTQYVMKKSKGVNIPRVSRRQAYYGKYVSRKDLKPGDLIFFDTSRRRRGYVNHVGIYIGNNKFIHASSAKHRVVITNLNRPFYRSRFKWGRRIN